MKQDYDIETNLALLEYGLNKASSVIAVIQQHYFDDAKEYVKTDPYALVWGYERYSNLLDVGLELINSAKETLAIVLQNIESGAKNEQQ